MPQPEDFDPQTEDGRLAMDETYANQIIHRLVEEEKGPLSLTLTEFFGPHVVAVRMNSATGDVYRVFREDQHWCVKLMKGKGYEQGVDGEIESRASWTDKSDRYCEHQIKLIEEIASQVLRVDQPLNLQLVSKGIEHEPEVNRYTFQSSIGKIRKHGRQVGAKVEGCIEFCELGKCVNMLSTSTQTAVTGITDSVPF